MKIAGGELRGRRLKVPAKGVRPTGERVREAIFSMLGSERVADAEVLDLFAGSGALGLEAWSRGAGRVTFVEKHRKGTALIKENIRELCGKGAPLEAMIGDAAGYLKRNSLARRFDIIFADPPYYEEWLRKMLEALSEGDALGPDGVLVFEQHRREPMAEVLAEFEEVFKLTKDKLYGTTRVLFIQRIEGSTSPPVT